MLKNRVLKLMREFIDEWLLGFKDEDLDVGMFSSEKLSLQNAIINTQRVNQLLFEYKMPYRLKAGIIGKLNVKSSMWNLFSDSFRMELTDVHFILGPSRDSLTDPDFDFPRYKDDLSDLSYDCEDQVKNLIKMHHFVHGQNKTKREYDAMVKKAERQYRKAYRERLRQEIAKKRAELEKKQERAAQGKGGDPKAKGAGDGKKKDDFKEPPLLGLFTRLFRGIKYDIRNIHIRYEDDFYSAQQPFSFGLTIKDIRLDTDVQQEKAEQKENSSTIVKL